MKNNKLSKEHIIGQSIKLFRQKTFYNTSMQDIALACGVLKGSLYHYFNSKEDIMFKVIESIHLYFNENVFVHAYNNDLESKQKLNQLLESAKTLLYNSDKKILYGNLGLESVMSIEVFNPKVRDFFNDFIKAIKTIYQEKYDINIAEELSERAVAEIEGSIMLSRIYNDFNYIKNTFQRIEDRMN